jgi:hypothetical protein
MIKTATKFATTWIIFTAAIAAACTCGDYEEPFLSVIDDSDMIFRVQIIEYRGKNKQYNLAMKAKILETLKGSIDRHEIVIWGDNGVQCRPYVNNFPLKSEWILAVIYIRDGKGKGDFTISNCGYHWLRVNNENVSGHISSATDKTETTLQDLRDTILRRRTSR